MVSAEIHSTGVSSTAGTHGRLLLLLASCFAILVVMGGSPRIAVLAADGLVSLYLIRLFPTRYAYAFILHPVLLAVSSTMFDVPFLSAGDGPAYAEVTQQYLDSKTLTFHTGELLNELGTIRFLTYTSPGIAPILAVPEFFFASPDDAVYYLWQGTFHLLLVSIVATLARSWRVMESRDLFAITAFAAISPSFFDLGAAPTRHIVTFFGVFLLFVTHIASAARLTPVRLVWTAVAAAALLVSKPALLMPYMIFAAGDLLLLRSKHERTWLSALSTAVLLLVGGVMMGSYFMETAQAYDETARTGAGTFSRFTEVPLLGWGMKYLYALLSPFPWSDGAFITETIYQGNWLLFVMHMLSALIGTHLFLTLLLNTRKIRHHQLEIKEAIAYAAIMSMSILKGSTGFHVYILIYFPFLAPLIHRKDFRISPFIVLALVACAEIAVVAQR